MEATWYLTFRQSPVSGGDGGGAHTGGSRAPRVTLAMAARVPRARLACRSCRHLVGPLTRGSRVAEVVQSVWTAPSRQYYWHFVGFVSLCDQKPRMHKWSLSGCSASDPGLGGRVVLLACAPRGLRLCHCRCRAMVGTWLPAGSFENVHATSSGGCFVVAEEAGVDTHQNQG